MNHAEPHLEKNWVSVLYSLPSPLLFSPVPLMSMYLSDRRQKWSFQPKRVLNREGVFENGLPKVTQKWIFSLVESVETVPLTKKKFSTFPPKMWLTLGGSFSKLMAFSTFLHAKVSRFEKKVSVLVLYSLLLYLKYRYIYPKDVRNGVPSPRGF